MRIEELRDVVDYFVLVESIETQRGDVKPLYFEKQKQNFSDVIDRIIHIKILERHPEMTPWERENFQRNQIIRGLRENVEDVILISDVDEIPKREVISRLTKSLKENPYNAFRLEQKMFFFHLNRVYQNGLNWQEKPWWGTIVTSYALLSKLSPQFFRDRRETLKGKVFNAGWHFSYMGGMDNIKHKLSCIVEGSVSDSLSDMEIQEKINRHQVIPIDESFPKYVQENIERLTKLGLIAKNN
jgi:beta-1,4-mannosyl-glycoprotein beta-1,4-N-acetylglucosaminyltransferase